MTTISRDELAKKITQIMQDGASLEELAKFFYDEHIALYSDPNRFDDDVLLGLGDSLGIIDENTELED